MAKNDEERFDLISKLVKNETKVKSSTNFHGQTLVFTNTRLRVQKLASLLKTIGVRSAYYHAGMTYTRRKRVEIAFEEGSLDVVTTTAALGAGADFPISQVIFERPGMGSRWITTAEYHQMAGRAGRYGFHDRGKAILIASPGEKIYPSQDKTEEQVAFELLTTDVEEIEGDIELEDESDQILAFISAAYPVTDEQISTYYRNLFYRTGQLRLILKGLTNKGLITEKQEKWHITPLGRAISASFLLPGFGYKIAKATRTKSISEMAIEIAPISSIYLSSRIHARIESALKYNVSRRFLSDSTIDIITGASITSSKKLPPLLINRIKEWNRLIFNCNCKSYPYCHHPIYELSKLVLDLRFEGLNPNQIAGALTERFDLYMYPGDLLNWLDEVVHAGQAIARLAHAIKESDVVKESGIFSRSIEIASKEYRSSENRASNKQNGKTRSVKSKLTKKVNPYRQKRIRSVKSKEKRN